MEIIVMKKILFAGAVAVSLAPFMAFADESASGAFAPGGGLFIAGGISLIDTPTEVTHTQTPTQRKQHKLTGTQIAGLSSIADSEQQNKELERFFGTQEKQNTGPVNQHIPLSAAGTRVQGTLSLGYNKLFDNSPLCIGIEGGIELSRTDRKTNNTILQVSSEEGRLYTDRCETMITTYGTTPLFGLRLGYVHMKNYMPYILIGLANTRVDYDHNLVCITDKGNKETLQAFESTINKWTSRYVVGLEKDAGHGLSARLELEYRAPSTLNVPEKGNHKWAWSVYTDAEGGEEGKINIYKTPEPGIDIQKRGGFVGRALLTYNIRI